MNLREYQELAMRTSTDNHDRVLNGCLGLIGEAGEIVDVIKKWMFQSGENPPFPKNELIKECGDVLWYCAETARGMGIDLHCAYGHLRDSYVFVMGKKYASSSVDKIASGLSFIAIRIYRIVYDGLFEASDSEIMEDLVVNELVSMIFAVEEFLKIHCDCTLETAMERNIEKLKLRYPYGFDPERSMHRPEYSGGNDSSGFLFDMRNKTI